MNLPAWHKPYGEALLETDNGILAELLAATEKAVFERLLELPANEDAWHERQDIRRAIDVILTLKNRGGSKTSLVGLPEVGLAGCGIVSPPSVENTEILSSRNATMVKVVIPFARTSAQKWLTRSATGQ